MLILRIWMVFLLFTGSGVYSAQNLSFSKIRHLYVEGEFDQIRIDLENFLRQSGKTAQPKERMFAYKYLGVVYASETQGYPLAETYFYQLLTLAPKAHLSDLYVSSAVEALFRKTQERFQREIRDNSELDGFGNPRREAVADSAPALTSGKNPGLKKPGPPLEKDSATTKAKTRKKEGEIRVWPYLVGVGVVGALGGYYWFATRDNGEDEVDARLPSRE